MTELQVRGTDRNEAAEHLRDALQRIEARLNERGEYGAISRIPLLDAALDWERRRTVERIRKRFNHARIDRDSDVFAILDESESPSG